MKFLSQRMSSKMKINRDLKSFSKKESDKKKLKKKQKIYTAMRHIKLIKRKFSTLKNNFKESRKS
jgi:hypothetical protein